MGKNQIEGFLQFAQFCLGVFYHLRHPMLALEHLRSVCWGTLILSEPQYLRPRSRVLRRAHNAVMRVRMDQRFLLFGFFVHNPSVRG
jgi:hypothetical protein